MFHGPTRAWVTPTTCTLFATLFYLSRPSLTLIWSSVCPSTSHQVVFFLTNAVSAGFDAAEGDEIGGCFVTPACYAHMTHALMALAGGKVVVCLEVSQLTASYYGRESLSVCQGGYNLEAISECAVAVTKTLMGEPPDRLKLTAPSKLAIEDVHKVMRRQAPYWFCLSAYGPNRGASCSSVLGRHITY